jgi:hypothetical protein
MRKLACALERGRPVVCAVNRAELPWCRVSNPLAGADPHHVAVIGADSEQVWLDDGSVHPLDLGWEEFARAWSAHRKGRHAMLTLPAEVPAERDLAGEIRAALSTTAAHLTGPVLGNSFDVNFGLSGMRRFRDQVADAKGRTGWERRFGGSRGATYFCLTRLHECLQREYTSPGAGRPAFADYLRAAAGIVGRPELTDAAALAADAGAVWQSIADTCVSAAPALTRYGELGLDRDQVRGALRVDDVEALAKVYDAIAGCETAFVADGGLTSTERREVFDRIAVGAERAVAIESELTARLTG